MKKNVALITLVTFILLCSSISAQSQIKKAYWGKWQFEAPTGQPGYTTGIIEIKKDSVITVFSGTDIKYPSTWIKFKNDTLSFNFNLYGIDCFCELKKENKKSLEGNASWDSGKSKLLLKKL